MIAAQTIDICELHQLFSLFYQGFILLDISLERIFYWYEQENKDVEKQSSSLSWHKSSQMCLVLWFYFALVNNVLLWLYFLGFFCTFLSRSLGLNILESGAFHQCRQLSQSLSLLFDLERRMSYFWFQVHCVKML